MLPVPNKEGIFYPLKIEPYSWPHITLAAWLSSTHFEVKLKTNCPSGDRGLRHFWSSEWIDDVLITHLVFHPDSNTLINKENREKTTQIYILFLCFLKATLFSDALFSFRWKRAFYSGIFHSTNVLNVPAITYLYV